MTSYLRPALMLLVLTAGLACHVKQEEGVAGPGSGASQVIKFENLTGHTILIRIEDANQEFKLERDENRTVEVRAEGEVDVFYVEIFRWRENQDLSVAAKWSGFVGIGKRVTVQHIARVYIND